MNRCIPIFFSFFFIQVIAWTPKLCFLWFMPKIESNISAANLYLLLHGLWRSYVQYVIAGHVMFSALGQIAIIIVHIFNFFILAGARHLGSLRGKMFHCFLLHYSRCVLRLRHIYIFLSVNRECLNWVFELIGQSRSVINQLEWSRLSAEGWNERRTFGEIAERKNREKLIMLGMKGDSASFWKCLIEPFYTFN